jgi:protein O-mannosyl-transferase
MRSNPFVKRGKKTEGKKRKPSKAIRSDLPFRIPLPWLWLIVAVSAVYISTLSFGFTELDDSIFIRENQEYNSHLANLGTSFHRGVFSATEDAYYRPLLLDSFLLNAQLSGTDIRGWHLVNVLLHLISVILLFVLLNKLRLEQTAAFLLALLYAVHPALSQAVAWIPGRNDTLLAIFVFIFLIGAMHYAETGTIRWLALQFLSLLASLFTKETAVFAAPVAFALLILVQNRKAFGRSSVVLYSSWLLAGITWFTFRLYATLNNSELQVAHVVKTFPARLPVLIQYLGKIFLPLNLGVFPTERDTRLIYGVIAVAFLALILFLSKRRNWRTVAAGFSVYILLFIPALMVPPSLNNQDFEHRVYLPMFGILIVLSQTVLLQNNWKPLSLTCAALALCLLLSLINRNHQKNFRDPVTFWSAAHASSPHSAYAAMMLGARLEKQDKQRSEQLIRASYAMDPKEKYINYYMGVLLQSNGSILSSEEYFLRELKISDYFQCYFHLARVAFEKNDKRAAAHYLEAYLGRNPSEEQANYNLLLLYLDTNQRDKALGQAQRMNKLALQVPKEAIDRLNRQDSEPKK